METNKVKVSNSPEHPIIRTIDELNNQEKKLINKLNHDCLAKVFMHLPILERLEMEKVCQKWAEAVEFSWYNIKKLDLNDLMIPLDKKEETLEIIMLKCCKYLRHLTIDGDHYPWMSYVLKENCKNITHFNIDMQIEEYDYKIEDEDVIEIISSMKKLKYLKIIKDQDEDEDITDNFCNEILDKLPDDMEHIYLILPVDEDNQIYQDAPELDKFKSLNCLTLHGFELTNETLKGILQNKSTLTKLDLSDCKYPSNPQSIFKNLKNLEHLNLREIYNFNVNEITSIAHYCTKLKHFEIGIMDIDGKQKKIPYEIFKELKYLNFQHFFFDNTIDKSRYPGDNIISGIADNWKGLKDFGVNEGLNFSPLDLQEISKFKYLQNLELGLAKIDSKSFNNIANNCLELKELSMDFEKLSKRDIEKLKNLNKIEELYFRGCKNLTGNSLSKIVNNCKNLIDLDLGGCYNLTEDSLIQVGKLINLKRLFISGIKIIPSAMFDELCNLEELTCIDCPSVNDEDIIKVIDNCKNLCDLETRKTGVTIRSLVHASKRKYLFKILTMYVASSIEDEFRKNNYKSPPYLRINGFYFE